jgi:hypothetical protein
MRRVVLLALAMILVLGSWSMVCADDFYVVPVVKAKSAPVPQTGQTATYAADDDGALQKGVVWPTPRFTDNNNGTVTDKLTGLIWMKNANAFGPATWSVALILARTVANNSYGLTDGSKPGDWRMPNLKELQSLVDYSHHTPALPEGHPFTGVINTAYWSSTTLVFNSDYVWYVELQYAQIYWSLKTNGGGYLWCVRGGK